jgi:hypothetical protein
LWELNLTMVLSWALLAAAAVPDPELIKRTANEVVHRPEFQLEPERNSSALLAFFLELVLRLLDALSGLWAISPVLAVVVIALLVVALVALTVHIVYTLRAAWAGEMPAQASLLKRRSVDPAQLEREAEEAAGRFDYIGAVRLLFRATVIRLDQRTGRTPRPGTTNREYLARYKAASFIGALRQFVDVIDAKWYGYGQCDADDYQRCRLAHGQILGTPEASA